MKGFLGLLAFLPLSIGMNVRSSPFLVIQDSLAILQPKVEILSEQEFIIPGKNQMLLSLFSSSLLCNKFSLTTPMTPKTQGIKIIH